MSANPLRTLVLPIAVVTAWLAAGSSASAEDPPTKELLDELLKEYKLYELPMPPKDAPLVRFPTGWSSTNDKGEDFDFLSLGFLIRPSNRNDPTNVFFSVGSIRELGEYESAKAIDATPAALKDINSPVDIAFAIQCHDRGWTDLALKAVESLIGHDKPALAAQLSKAAWTYWQLKILIAGSDREGIAKSLHLIWKRRAADFGESERDFLKSLDLSLASAKGKPGSIEELIDDLIEVTITEQTEDGGALFKECHKGYVRLARKGFDAVPALIEHLNDERLTRARKQGFNNFHDYHYKVADVVSDLLQGLAGHDIGQTWVARQVGVRLDRADVEKWWEEAKKIGEEKYFVEHVFITRNKSESTNRLMLHVLAFKYPKQLPAIYRKVLDGRLAMDSAEIAQVVAESALPKETKQELFEYAARHKKLDHRLRGIDHLQTIDPSKALKLLLAELNTVPATPDGPYWICPESWLAGFVVAFDDPEAWAALEKTAKRVDVGLRMQYLHDVTGRDLPEKTRKTALQFLAKFLDDKELRIAKGPKYDGPYAGIYGDDRLEVRNYAAEQISWVLRFSDRPRKGWTDAQWAKLRDDVRKALAKEGIR